MGLKLRLLFARHPGFCWDDGEGLPELRLRLAVRAISVASML
jgi:hypothetical protein